jgi:Na+/glutamate symporter
MNLPTSRLKVAVMGFVAGAVVGAVVTRMIIQRKQKAPAPQPEGSVGSAGADANAKRPLTTEASVFAHEANRIVKRLAEDIDDLIVETRDRLSRQA